MTLPRNNRAVIGLESLEGRGLMSAAASALDIAQPAAGDAAGESLGESFQLRREDGRYNTPEDDIPNWARDWYVPYQDGWIYSGTGHAVGQPDGSVLATCDLNIVYIPRGGVVPGAGKPFDPAGGFERMFELERIWNEAKGVGGGDTPETPAPEDPAFAPPAGGTPDGATGPDSGSDASPENANAGVPEDAPPADPDTGGGTTDLFLAPDTDDERDELGFLGIEVDAPGVG